MLVLVLHQCSCERLVVRAARLPVVGRVAAVPLLLPALWSFCILAVDPLALPFIVI